MIPSALTVIRWALATDAPVDALTRACDWCWAMRELGWGSPWVYLQLELQGARAFAELQATAMRSIPPVVWPPVMTP